MQSVAIFKPKIYTNSIYEKIRKKQNEKSSLGG